MVSGRSRLYCYFGGTFQSTFFPLFYHLQVKYKQFELEIANDLLFANLLGETHDFPYWFPFFSAFELIG